MGKKNSTEKKTFSLQNQFSPSLLSGKCGCLACLNARQAQNELVGEDPTSAGDNSNQLSSYYLISQEFSNHTKNIVNASYGETLYYYIEDEAATWELANGRTLEAYNHSDSDEFFIESLFDKVDSIIDLDFERTYDDTESSFDFYSVWEVYDWSDSTLGQVDNQRGNAYYWDVIWKDSEGNSETTALDKFVIVHELGHALGLSHPNEQPTNPLWNTNDTVMSYNTYSGYKDWYRDTDLEALVKIWGTENDHKYTRFASTSTWSSNLLINRGVVGNNIANQYIQANQIQPYEWTQAEGSVLVGTNQHEVLRGLSGWDVIHGEGGDDLIHGGNGRDIIDGGTGSDELHGDFGWNTYKNQRDGSIDLIAIKSDQILYNWWLGTSGNNADGRKADIIEGLDWYDEIKIIGASQSELSFQDNVTHRGVTGIGIYANNCLEALYTGGLLSIERIKEITTGDNSYLAMNNRMWNYDSNFNSFDLAAPTVEANVFSTTSIGASYFL